MGRSILFLALLTMLAAPALAAAPGPDPRLEAALSIYVFSQQERSVDVSRTMPLIARAPKPAVDHGEGLQVSEDVYVERRLMPGSSATKDRDAPKERDAVRIFRRDAR